MNLLIHGDSLEMLPELDENSIDAVICDPPYELGFMGKKWDGTGIANSVELWTKVLRVTKPGGFLLAFGGTRTFHRMVCAIEDAGWEIRDSISWVYGSGFPKSTDISKQIDKQAGAKREVVGSKIGLPGYSLKHQGVGGILSGRADGSLDNSESECEITSPATDAAKQWSGWGTALKPAHEDIIVARKPIPEKTVAANILRWGTGALNIDKSRIGIEERTYKGTGAQPNKLNNHEKGDTGIGYMNGSGKDQEFTVNGRWPANLILDEEAGKLLDEQSGETKSGAIKTTYKRNVGNVNCYSAATEQYSTFNRETNSGGASRFFLNIKDNTKICGITLENQKVVGITNGVYQEVERYTLAVEQLLCGKNTMENFQTDITFTIKTLIKLMTELKILKPFQNQYITKFMEEKEKITNLLTELNTETVRNVENISLLINFKYVLLELIKDIAKNVNVQNLESGENKTENTGTSTIETIENATNRFFYCPKVSKSERNIGCKSLIIWENVDHDQETEVLYQLTKDISEDTMQSLVELEWSTILSGKNITDQFLQDMKYITKIISNLITELKTLNFSQISSINDYIRDAIKTTMEDGLNLAENAGNLNLLIPSTIDKKTELALGVVNAALQTLSKIKDKGKQGNVHATIKPIALMAYLCNLVTRPNGTILDPFAGSGSTGIAAIQEGFNFIGIEKEKDYVTICKHRILTVDKNLEVIAA